MSESDPAQGAMKASVLLNALVAGKPPASREGASFFFGRATELNLLGRDLGVITEGHSTIRFIVGVQGSGKSALLHEFMSRARRQRFVTIDAAFSRACLLHGNDGEGRALLETAMLNMKTLGSSGLGALDAIIGGFRDRCEQLAQQSGRDFALVQVEQLVPLQALPRGRDFARVIVSYMNHLDDPD